MRTSFTGFGLQVAAVALVGGSSFLSAQDALIRTTESGVRLVAYSALPVEPATALEPDLVVGTGSRVVFGDVRGLEMTPDGTVLVLDHQASELWEFDVSGRALGTIFTRGQGPREIAGANGVRLDHEGAIWVNDPGNGRLTRLLPNGEVETLRRFVPGFGYRWIGAVTDDGRVWERRAHAERRGPRIPEPGLYEGSSRFYFKSLHRQTGETDSVFVGRMPVRQLNLPRGVIPVPFRPERLQTIAASGVIWTALSNEYRLVQLSSDGDTTLVVEVAAAQEQVSPQERAREIIRVEEFMERAGRVSVNWDDVMPDRKPIMQHLIADDQGGLWVQSQRDGVTLFDRFSDDGQFLGRYRADYVAHSWPPTIRNGWLLAVQVDEFEVQSVVGFRFGR